RGFFRARLWEYLVGSRRYGESLMRQKLLDTVAQPHAHLVQAATAEAQASGRRNIDDGVAQLLGQLLPPPASPQAAATPTKRRRGRPPGPLAIKPAIVVTDP